MDTEPSLGPTRRRLEGTHRGDKGRHITSVGEGSRDVVDKERSCSFTGDRVLPILSPIFSL